MSQSVSDPLILSHTENITDAAKRAEMEAQLKSLEDLNDEKHKFYAIGMVDIAVIVYGELFIRCDAIQPNDKENTWVFRGQAGGLLGLALFKGLEGHIRTDDVEKLLRETRRFQVTASPVWTSVVFLDKKSKVLGNYQAGTLGLLIGLSGGKGKFKRKAVELTLQAKTDKALQEARKQITEAKREINTADQIVKEQEKARAAQAQAEKLEEGSQSVKVEAV